MAVYWGIDAEGTSSGIEPTKDDIHTIQVCSSEGEHTGKVFWNKQDFKDWFLHKTNKPKIFYAFTLPFEYGSLLAWELVEVQNGKGKYPWQAWADQPINLFYIQVDRTRIPIFDIRAFFYQLRYGNNYLTTLKALGDYLSAHYGEDIRKLEAPLGEDFGKRPPRKEEEAYFEEYGKRDAYIPAKAAQWFHKNILQKWLQNKVQVSKLYSWGTIAKYYFNLPKLNKIQRFGKSIFTITFPNLWHQRIFNNTYAGRSEAFWTGNVGQAYYNDVSSLYPVSMIQTQCMLIKNIDDWIGNPNALLGKQMNWQDFYNLTGKPYGWILGTFHTEDDLWGLPVKVGDNNLYLTGTFQNRLYHTLDLEASKATILDIQNILVPVFDEEQKKTMKHFEELTQRKLQGEYRDEIEKFCIKSTTNSASGIMGKSRPYFGDTTNLPGYNTLLAQSHLDMSKIFHLYHSPQHPIYYTDTDSFFWHKPVEKTIEDCQPYPGLPFQIFDTVPLEVGERGTSRPEGTVIFRGKMYYQNENSLAFSGWKPFPKFFTEIVEKKKTEIIVERQVVRKWKTRDKLVTVLKVGRWLIKKEHWKLPKLKRIFRADPKRNRESRDSYQLFLEDECQPSKAWTIQETNRKLSKKPWKLTIKTELEALEEMLSEYVFEGEGG